MEDTPHLLPRANSMRFEEYRDQSEQRYLLALGRRVSDTIGSNVGVAIVLLILLSYSKVENWGDDIRVLLERALFLKMVIVVPYQLIIYGLAYIKWLNWKIATVLLALCWLSLLGKFHQF